MANVPLIDYTLEFLDMNNVQEVIIYTSNHTDQIESYINEHPRWSPSNKTNPFSAVDLIRVSDASSVGDFLRDLDTKGLVSTDFILVHGDCVANINLESALAKHKARREANREAIMTVVLMDSGLKDNRTKVKGATPVFAIEPDTGRVVQYEEMNPLAKSSDRYLLWDKHIFTDFDAMDLRADIIDPGIDICTPDALALWSESFDYELPRKNFLHGVLKDWELNGKFIYSEILDEGYAARASNLQMYDSVSRDVIDRITFPFVPDSNMVQGHSYSYTYKNGVAQERGVEFEHDTVVSKSILGHRTSVGTGTKISHSTIGRRCYIGPNVTIEDSYIWDDATIEEGAVITRSIVGTSATVGKNCRVGAGSLISFNVMISENVTIPPATALSFYAPDGEAVKHDLELLGPRGKGAIYKYEEENDDLDPRDPSRLQRSLIYSTEGFNISTSSVSTLASRVLEDSDSDNSDNEDDPDSHEPTRGRLSSFGSEDSSASQAALSKQKALFHREAVNGLLDALRSDAADFNNAKIEFTSLRAAENASDSSMRRAVAAAFVQRAVELVSEDGVKPAKAAESAITAKPGAVDFIRAVGVGSGEQDEQVDFVLALQRSLEKSAGAKGVETAQAGTLLAALLQHMYNADILEESGILAWWTDDRGKEGETLSALRARCEVLIDWLEESSEDEDDEDEDEDEDSD